MLHSVRGDGSLAGAMPAGMDRKNEYVACNDLPAHWVTDTTEQAAEIRSNEQPARAPAKSCPYPIKRMPKYSRGSKTSPTTFKKILSTNPPITARLSGVACVRPSPAGQFPAITSKRVPGLLRRRNKRSVGVGGQSYRIEWLRVDEGNDAFLKTNAIGRTE